MSNDRELLPDFEYYGNVLSDVSDTEGRDSYPGRVVESDQSREQRRMAEEEYRDTPAPVDRFGHDYNMSSFSSPYVFGGEGDRGQADENDGDEHNDGVSPGCAHGMCDGREGYDDSEWDGEHTDRADRADRSENTEQGNVPGSGRTRRPMRRSGMFRPDRPIGGHGRHESAPPDDGCEACAASCPDQKPHPLLNFSVEEGDLLLLVLLALLAGEDGCADLVATLALLLMIRQN